MASTNDIEENQGAKQKRTRSPSYPSDGLETCFKWAKKIYEAEKRNATSQLIAVKHMGYSSLSGSSRTALAAMKKFGLLVEEAGERVRISDETMKLLLDPDEDNRLALLRKMAKRPEIIKDLLAQHPDGLPSDESLRYNLVMDRGFGEDATGIFIRALRETVRFAKLDEIDNSSPTEEMIPELSSIAPGPIEPPAPESSRIVAGTGTIQGQSKTAAVSLASVSKQHAELSDGTQVDLQIVGPFGADVLEELLQYLDIWTKILRKRSGANTPAA